ncbi:hypothetical protein KY334_01445 [Candidatus Woesearchaeota archaeon]|nr:hypothetical protein [Candidatus Woesearchaeota archaeon]
MTGLKLEYDPKECFNTIGEYLFQSNPHQYVALMNMFNRTKMKLVKNGDVYTLVKE